MLEIEGAVWELGGCLREIGGLEGDTEVCYGEWKVGDMGCVCQKLWERVVEVEERCGPGVVGKGCRGGIKVV